MSLQGGNSNQVNLNHVTSVKRQRAGNLCKSVNQRNQKSN